MNNSTPIENSSSGCNHCDDGHHHHIITNDIDWKSNWHLLLALLILVVMLTAEYGFGFVPNPWINLSINTVAYLLAGFGVLKLALKNIIRGNIFNEFVLMSVATLGAFYIGAYSEGVAVMVFYCIGEWFQDVAVNRVKRNIKALLDIRPDEVTVIRNGIPSVLHPSEAEIGETISIKNGEKAALDGILLSETGAFNSAALTGESAPVYKKKSDPVYAGMINLNHVVELKVTQTYKNSALSRILQMVQDASARKSTTQLFISRFAKVYTPIVFFLALGVIIIPSFFVSEYYFYEWFYRSLVFLVISCPCALVISIPLGYFGGIGLGSRNGILFKGGNYLDIMTKIDTVVMDKTGTLTQGVFKVQQIISLQIPQQKLLQLAAVLEKYSSHPIGRAVMEAAGDSYKNIQAEKVEEFPGMGLKGIIEGQEILIGNQHLFNSRYISFPDNILEEEDTTLLIAIDNQYAGYLLIADEIKEDAAATIRTLHKMNIKTIMLSGDKQKVVSKVAKQLNIAEAYGDLLPEQKLEKVQFFKNKGGRIAFAGDGVNDAPVIAMADAGIAMGGLGSNAAIETADIVIQNDQPSKIVTAIKIGKITKSIVWQNIILAMLIKGLVLVLGAKGVATLWEAVIADVGVALLAILNAVRIQRKQF